MFLKVHKSTGKYRGTGNDLADFEKKKGAAEKAHKERKRTTNKAK